MVCLSNLIIALDVFHLSHLQFLPKATFFLCVWGPRAGSIASVEILCLSEAVQAQFASIGVGDHPTPLFVDNGVRGGL